MTQHLYLVLLQAFLVSLIGGAGGVKYTLRTTPTARQPSGRRQTTVCLASGIGGMLLAVIFGQALVMFYPLAPEPNLFMIQLLLGFGIAKMATKRFLYSRGQESQPKSTLSDA